MAQFDREKIKGQAKIIMDEFVKALDKVGEVSGEVGIERDEQTRAGKPSKPDADFRKRMLKNAPRKDDSYLLAEKKSW